MAEKRKISIRKILQTLFSLVAICACIIALSSASKIENIKTLSKIEIDISNEDKYRFLDDKKVMEIVNRDYSTELTRVPIGKLDTRNIEHTIVTNPWVQDAQVYIDNALVLHLFITQRTPVTRILETTGNSYYLDKSLSVMPLSADYVQYTTMVTNVPPLKDDSAGKALKGQIVSIMKFIEIHPFWMAQISHLTIDSNKDFVLVPVLGNHKIILGDTTRLKEKFDDLFVFYKKISNRIGWDKYEILDLRYKGQVVASPALPWKGPVDKAMVNMNWAKSMIDSNSKSIKETGKDTVHAKVIPAKVAPQAIIKKNIKKQDVKGKKESIKHKASEKNTDSSKKNKAKKIESKKNKEHEKEKRDHAKYIYQKKTNN